MPEMISAEVIAATGTILVTIGGAVKWVVNRIDARREKYESEINKRIKALEEKVQTLEDEKTVYMQRIIDLEMVMRVAKIPLPETQGWPIVRRR